jgi:Predicted transcriptional regulators
VNRVVYDETPPVVEYSLTDIGQQLVPILEKMDAWGKKYVGSYKPQ